MRVLKLGLLSSLAMAAIGSGFSTSVSGQDPRFIGGGPGITVFEDRNFRGDAATYENNVSNLPSRFNNRISSFRVGNGERWQVCDQANYRGQCVTVSGEESDLRQNNWDNRISSMRRLGGGGGGWPGGGGGWNGNPNRPPTWMVGTFYSSYPRITLTIQRDGTATAVLNGESFTGGYQNGRLYINNNWSTVTRLGNGIRTYNQNTGSTTDYSRSWGGDGGGGGGGDWDGPSSAPPSWAIGTFYADNSDASMRITRDGRITINYQGQAFNGRYYAGQIYANGNVSSVMQTSSGFQTYNRNTGERINYRRRRETR